MTHDRLEEIITEICSAPIDYEQHSLWRKYQKTFAYAKDIEFVDTCDAVLHILTIC